MKAGAATADITPKPGTHLAGSVGSYRPAQSALDPLYARAAVFESDGRKLCFLSLDVTIIAKEYTNRIRDEAARRHGFEREAVMVHATQTHSAPSIGHFMVDQDFPPVPADREFVRGGDLAYADFAVEQAIEAIGRACARLEPVRIATGSGARDGLAFNRRGVMRDGKVGMPWFYSSLQHPLGRTDYRHLEGPTDPEVGILCARNGDMRMTAMLLHHTCHPVNVYAQPGAAVSADWPGAWADALQAVYGTACAPLVLNGCCGNINPWPAFEPDFHPDHRRMGRALGGISEKIIRAMTFSEESALDWKVRIVRLPVRQVDERELREAEAYLAKNPDPPWLKDNPRCVDGAWNRAAWLWSIELMRRRSPQMEYEIQVFRVGNAAFVGLPGEPFVEGQLAIKIASPASWTCVVHCTTQYVAYLPTREAYARGGHEVFFCKVAPGSLEMVVDAATGLLREVFIRDASG
ncbi:MAG: hypothetical protein HY360_07085 [Verrucomicrobia bacterium]|nr:hypothetical protein [Verrucomicrobiota bacterium]